LERDSTSTNISLAEVVPPVLDPGLEEEVEGAMEEETTVTVDTEVEETTDSIDMGVEETIDSKGE
jgi:hypothetical protein